MFKMLFAANNLVARTIAQVAVVGAVGSVGLSVATTSTAASLSAAATNTTPQAITSGVLSLTQGVGSTSTGFGTTISGVAPGDINNYLVDLTTGTASNLAGQALTLSMADTGGSLLTTSATKGLEVTVNECSVAWTVAGVCSGTTTTPVAQTFLASLGTKSVIAGAVTNNTVHHYQFSLLLPTQSETTTNGVLPGSTIQGLSASITWTFTDSQAAAKTTNA